MATDRDHAESASNLGLGPSSNDAGPQCAREEKRLIFRALNTTLDSTRFVRIEQAEAVDDAIVCKHVHLAFADRPRFLALSYMWGDVRQKEVISLNGSDFLVGRNLRAALIYLRRLNRVENSPDRLFWIDALCINQDDVEERARQVRWMGQIYFRARQVLVWLGDKYATYQKELNPAIFQDALPSPGKNSKKKKATPNSWDLASSQGSFSRRTSLSGSWVNAVESELLPERHAGPSLERSTTRESSNSEVLDPETAEDPYLSQDPPRIQPTYPEQTKLTMATELANDEYWTRLWIIQEIVRARELHVCFGTWKCPWSPFMAVLRQLVGSGPALVLNEQVRETPNGQDPSHSLRKLLENHRDAKCKDRRDKVYGLVGFAADAPRFPVDYSRSCVGVWIDTVEYMSIRKLLKSDDLKDLISFGRLLKQLLIKDEVESFKELLQQSETKSGYCAIEVGLEIPAYVLGYIRTLGPSCEDWVSKLSSDVEIDWNNDIRANYQQNVNDVNKENNTLFWNTLDLRDEELSAMAVSHASGASWRDPNCWADGGKEHQEHLRNVQSIQSPHDPPRRGSTADGDASPDLSQSRHGARFYQLHPLGPDKRVPKFGICPRSAQLGDLVCWVRPSKRAILIRLVQGPDSKENMPDHYQIRGTATASYDITDSSGIDHESRINGLDNSGWLAQGGRQLHIPIDAMTLYILLPESGKPEKTL